jgi:hypothetical protein
MSVILAIQEAEIRRIMVWSQPLANNVWDPILEKTHHKNYEFKKVFLLGYIHFTGGIHSDNSY